MLTIDILDAIGTDFWGEGITARTITAQLAGHKGPVKVRLNSPGGDVFEGVTIYNTLRSHPGKVHVEIHGLAASIASIIALAGDTRTAMTGSMMMLHDPHLLTRGNESELLKAADMLASVRASLVDIYEERSGMSNAEIVDILAKETWFSAEDMLARGLVTQVSESDSTEVAELAASLNDNTPRFAAILAHFERPFNRERPRAQPPTPKKTNMDKILAALGLPAGASEEAVLASIAQKGKPDIEKHIPRAEYDRLAGEHNALKAEFEKTKVEAHTRAVDSEIQRALDGNKIVKSEVDFYRASCESEKGLQAFRKFHEGRESMNLTVAEVPDVAPGADLQDSLTSDEAALIKHAGVSREQYIKARNTRRAK